MNFTMSPVAYVRAGRTVPEDDYWGGTVAEIELVAGFDAEALQGLDASRTPRSSMSSTACRRKDRHRRPPPRNNPDWPKVGIFAQRGKGRPNRIGTTIVKIVRVHDRTCGSASLTPSTAPHPRHQARPTRLPPRSEVREPTWSQELMQDYWSTPILNE